MCGGMAIAAAYGHAGLRQAQFGTNNMDNTLRPGVGCKKLDTMFISCIGLHLQHALCHIVLQRT